MPLLLGPHLLKRQVNHDPRSRHFKAATVDVTKPVNWRHYGAVLDQGDLGSCHDPETEILTRSGWLPFPDLTMADEVATVDPATRELSYEHPTRVIAKQYKGPMYRVANQRHDFSVTENHSMLVRKWDERARTLASEFSFTEMKNVGWYAGLMGAVAPQGGTRQKNYVIPGIPGAHRRDQREDRAVPMAALLGFLGIYLAEGTILTSTAKKSYNKVQLAASKEREKGYIRGVLDDMGIHYLELKDRFTFQEARLYAHLESLGLKGLHAAEKSVPGFVFALPAEDIDAFLEGHRMGDGSFQDGQWTHYTSSPQLVEDLQRLMFLAGHKTGVSVRPARASVMTDGRVVTGIHPEYSVRQLRTNNACIERKKDVTIEDYEGMVYCAEVPTHHTLVTRRNGKILIAGNCTANAMEQWRKCKPEYRAGTTVNEAGALALYHLETTLQGGPVYPPADPGGSGLMVCKAAKQLGYISSYTHAFGPQHAVGAIGVSPFLVGVNWYEGMFTPNANGLVSISGTVQGGHEFVCLGYDPNTGLWKFLNSWGSQWSLKGVFYMDTPTFTRLLNEQGDITVPVP